MLLTLLATSAPCVWLIGVVVLSRFCLRLGRRLVGLAPAAWESLRYSRFRKLVVSRDLSDS